MASLIYVVAAMLNFQVISILKMMDFVLKLMDFVLKMMDFVLKMMNFQLVYYDVAWVGDYYFYDKVNLLGAIIFMIEPRKYCHKQYFPKTVSSNNASFRHNSSKNAGFILLIMEVSERECRFYTADYGGF